MYVSLHNHTSYSLLDGVGNPGVWVKAAHRLGMPALGISDHGSISGVVDFWRQATKIGVTPIIGVELYIAEPGAKIGRNEDDQGGAHPATRFHACVYAKDNDGFTSITKALTLANQQFYRRPVLSLDQMLEMKHVVVTSACYYGLIRRDIVRLGTIAQCAEALGDDFYLEIHPHDVDDQRMINRLALKLAKRHDLPLVVAGDCHYPSPDLEEIQEILLATGGRKTLKEYRENPWFSVHGLYLRTEGQIAGMFSAYHPYIPKSVVQGAMDNTMEIVDKCNQVDLSQRPVAMPHIPNANAEFKRILLQALRFRFGGKPPRQYIDRMVYELDVIKRTGFLDYFLIVRDVVEWSRRNGVEVGPGRGSVGGSIVAWLLGIHRVDPIKHGLFFERFLNPDRISPPDIDLDFAMDRREEVLEYLREKYGREHVANISTFLTMKGRTALKDVLRVYGYSPQFAQKMANEVDDALGLLDSIKESAVLKDFARANRAIVTQALKLEGQVRGAGQHAAGVVVSDKPLDTTSVLEKRSGIQVVNWDMHDAEHLGLLKLDALGLRTCSIIKRAVELAGVEVTPENDIWEVVQRKGINDPKVLTEFARGNTIGVFQFESGGMRELLKSLAPIKRFETLADATALFRPGPKDSGLKDLYVQRYHGLGDVEYPHKDVEGALSPTMGVMVYQEQTMAVARDLAGFSLAEADTLRKAIGKKKHDLMAKIQPRFVGGASKKITEEAALEIWDQLKQYASYSFNKAHATFYSLISYTCMWLKVYHPLPFFCALLQYTTFEDKLVAIRQEMRRLKIPLLPPSIYTPGVDVTVDKGGVRLGLGIIKGVGPAALEAIQAAAPFEDFNDFLDRVVRRKCNKTVIKALIAARAVPDAGPRDISEFFGEDHVRPEFRQKALGPFAEIKIPLTPFDRLKLLRIKRMSAKLKQCKECEICRHSGCHGPVPPVFTKNSKVMVVAESPGREEDASGRVLVGRSGKELTRRFRAVGLTRDQLYLTNVYKCRPPDNKIGNAPPPTCFKWLKREIETIKPKVIISFGRHAMQYFGERGSVIGRSGEVVWLDDIQAWLVLCAHPGWVFRGDSDERRATMGRAFEALSRIIEE